MTDENTELEEELKETTERITQVIQSRKDKILELHEEIEELEGKNRELESTLETLLESIKG
jgi:chromosome segregation ATPase